MDDTVTITVFKTEAEAAAVAGSSSAFYLNC